jgi:hypothetical protein
MKVIAGGFQSQEIHLVDQYLLTFIHKGGFLIVKNIFNILQVSRGEEGY